MTSSKTMSEVMQFGVVKGGHDISKQSTVSLQKFAVRPTSRRAVWIWSMSESTCCACSGRYIGCRLEVIAIIQCCPVADQPAVSLDDDSDVDVDKDNIMHA
jgi:hypothetical protein